MYHWTPSQFSGDDTKIAQAKALIALMKSKGATGRITVAEMNAIKPGATELDANDFNDMPPAARAQLIASLEAVLAMAVNMPPQAPQGKRPPSTTGVPSHVLPLSRYHATYAVREGAPSVSETVHESPFATGRFIIEAEPAPKTPADPSGVRYTRTDPEGVHKSESFSGGAFRSPQTTREAVIGARVVTLLNALYNQPPGSRQTLDFDSTPAQKGTAPISPTGKAVAPAKPATAVAAVKAKVAEPVKVLTLGKLKVRRDHAGAGTGAVIGLALAGPPGALVGAGLGWVAGRLWP